MTINRKQLRKKVKEFVSLFLIISSLTVASIAIGKFALESTVAESVVDTYEQPKEAMEEIVKRIADENDVPWLMIFRIIECESRWDRYFKERMRNGSYDRGLFAFNSTHYKHVSNDCAFDPECATLEFVKAYKKGNINHWLCTKLLGYSK